MILVSPEQLDLFWLEEAVWVAEDKINVPAYDFNFENLFACRRPLYREEEIMAVGRFGVSENYSELYKKLSDEGITLIHSPHQYLLASELTEWYPLLKDHTPFSLWFDKPPDYQVIENNFDYPVFLKGSRQTSRHKAVFSIINSRKEYEIAAEHFKHDAILNWQKFVVREYVDLRKVKGKTTEKIPPAFEFRTFWWKGSLVGDGAYWKDFANYNWTASERLSALNIAGKAVEKLNLPFVVIDIAQDADGEWIIIECNDGQESGYANISPISLWQKIIEIEKNIKPPDFIAQY